jgi:hypothetical protein
MPQQQRVGRDESARLFRTSGRVTRSCCPAWCARSLGRDRVASTALLTAGVDDPGITVIIARRALLARPGQRVRHRLTPTHDAWHRPMAGIGRTADAASHPVGARRCLARRATGAATSVACIDHLADRPTTMPIASPRGSRPSGPAGQAPPDPYNMGDHPPPPGLPIPPPACCPNCVGARRCLARRASRRGKRDGTYRTTRISAPRSRRIIVFPAAFSGSPRGR